MQQYTAILEHYRVHDIVLVHNRVLQHELLRNSEHQHNIRPSQVQRLNTSTYKGAVT